MTTIRLGKSLLVGAVLLALMFLAGSMPWSGAYADQSGDPAAMTPPSQGAVLQPVVSQALQHDVSPPLLFMAPLMAASAADPRPPRSLPGRTETGAEASPQAQQDPVRQDAPGQTAMPEPFLSFEGIPNVDNVLPPDTIGDVGPDHYVQMVNVSFAIWSKTGVKLYGPAAIHTLWQGFGGPCEGSDDGDPVVLYDPLADRWLMSQFALPNFPAGPYYQCIAISRTGDPTGAWHRYAFLYHQTKMNDYPKFGVWPDGYYMSANQFTFSPETWAGQGVAVFERDKMLAGLPARMIQFDLYGADPRLGGMLPSDLDGLLPPPEGAPNYFVEVDHPDWGFPQSQLQLWQFWADWAEPAASRFIPFATLPVAAFDSTICSGRNCIPQPGVSPSSYLDAISDRLMYRAAYRNFGTYQSLLLNHTVDAGNGRAGIRWYELRAPNSPWEVIQQGTYAPDSTYRWMGSLAMDAAGNIALGYSVSSASIYPSIRYAGRLAGDPDGVLSQAETSLQTGSGVQLSDSGRWGDYSMMAVDPVDDCTFWYTQEYYQATSDRGWQTRVGAFRFPSCTSSLAGALQGRVTDAVSGAPVAQAHVQLGAYSTETGTDGRYRFDRLPAGTHTLTVSAYGFGQASLSGVVVLDGATAIQDASLVALPSLTLSGVVTDGSGQGWPLYAKIDISDYPFGPIFTDPVTGEYSVDLFEGASYTLTVAVVTGGYASPPRSFTLTDTSRVQNFDLLADPAACSALGYVPSAVWAESFETSNGGFYEVEIRPSSWEWGVPTSGPGVAHSGTKVWATNLSGDYANNEDGYLVSPPINLTALSWASFELSWWQWLVTEPGYDYAGVEVSRDGGATWQQVFGYAGGAVDSAWRQFRVRLDHSFASANFKIAFRLRSDYSVTYPGYYVDDVAIFFGCEGVEGGLIVGNVLDANVGTGLNGALVTHAGGATATTQATPADPALPDGFYQLFAPAGAGVMTVTLSGGYGPAVEHPTVALRGVVRQDFHLPAGQLAVQPEQVSVEVEWNATASLPLTLRNQGGRQATWEIRPVASTGQGAHVQTTVTAPEIKRLASSGPFDRPPDVLQGDALKRDSAVSQSLAPSDWGLAAPIPSGPRYRSASATCDGVSYYVFGGADPTQVFRESWRYDSSSDAWTRLADMPMALMNMYASCVENIIYLVGGYDGSGQTNAFQIYDVALDAWQLRTWPVVGTPMSIAFEGLVYAFGDSFSGTDVWRYNPVTAEWALLPGQMPIQVGYAGVAVVDEYIFIAGGGGPMSLLADVQRYHPATNTWDTSGPALPNARMNANVFWYGDLLYMFGGGGYASEPWLAFGDTWTLDPSLWPGGAWADQGLPLTHPVVAPAPACVSDKIFALGGVDGPSFSDTNQYLDAGVRCHGPDSAPAWLSAAPAAGVLAAGGQATVTLAFDAGQANIPEPGVYRAELQVREDTPYDAPSVPVTLTVTLPMTYGLLQGTVSSLGYCDAQPGPLADAEVQVTSATGALYMLDVDSSGAYHVWLPVAESPYRVLGWDYLHEVTIVQDVAIAGRTTTTVDLDLRLTQPCSVTAPDSFAVTVAQGFSLTLPLTITNSGGDALVYDWREKSSLPGVQPPPQGGPDPFGYTYRDNRTQGGPTYQWVEIAPPAGGSGVEITALSGVDDAYFWPLALPFSFPFYSQDYSTLAVSSNGILYFEDRSVFPNNTPIPGPTPDGLQTLIAPLWDDAVINPGAVYYKVEPDRLIIEYFQITPYNATQYGTWEVILFANGNILYQYQDVRFDSSFYGYGASATVGIQGSGEVGLSYSFNTPRLTNGLAICFAHPGESGDCNQYADLFWLGVAPDAGLVESDSAVVSSVSFDATMAPAGVYAGNLALLSNDPGHGLRLLPVQMTVVEPTPVISDIRLTNVSDTAASITWLTDVAAEGVVVFGLDPDHVHRTVSDDRGQGIRDDTHFVTLRGLAPNTTYYFSVRSGPSQSDNAGAFYRFKTGPMLALPPTDTVFGRVLEHGGAPAGGALVFLNLQDADGLGSSGQSAPLSAWTDADGYWSANLGAIRTRNLSRYFTYSAPGDGLLLEVRAAGDGATCPAPIDAGAAHPAPDLLLGPENGCANVAQLTLKRGWNFIALPLTPLAPLTAVGFCTDVKQQGGAPVEIDRWHQAGWDGHACAAPANDFGLALGSGYFVRNNAASLWSLAGAAVTQPVTLTLRSGWNAISIPHTAAYTASSLCSEIIAQGAPAIEIDRWQDSGWNGHLCGLGFNDFAIERQRGYFLRVDGAWVIVPQAPPAQSEPAPPAALSGPPAAVPAEAVAASAIQIANLRDASATITWLTDVPATGFVRYGEGEALDSYAFDARGYDAVSRTHYAVLDGLKPDTTYFYRIVSGAEDGAANAPASFRTASSLNAPPAPDTVYGQVFRADGVTPAAGAILHLTLQDADGQGTPGQALPMAALVDEGGYWYANLGNARQLTSGQPFGYSPDGDRLAVAVQSADGLAWESFAAAALRPAAPVVFGQGAHFYLPLVGREMSLPGE